MAWEYPGAASRGGRPEDFANYPVFLRNLKAALTSSSGGRSGLSMALPLSYRYLQHFDIANLSQWIDWFNVRSYDLRGLWNNTSEQWSSPGLGSHTNLTEIADDFDFLWRNNVDPKMVNFGVAFHARTFLANDTGCVAAGCPAAGAGAPGPCTGHPGVLSNAEIGGLLSESHSPPVLDQAAAAKVLAVGREWIAYDDAATWKLKLDFARSRCIGGVAAFAVGEDHANGTYSLQLQSATGYASRAVAAAASHGLGRRDDTVVVLREQCYWANCGVPCAAGFSNVARADPDASENEVMQDGNFCRNGQLRVFCCPSSGTLPRCGWWDFYNGDCGAGFGSRCPKGFEKIGYTTAEVGSVSFACHVNGGAEVGCCETSHDLTQDIGYDYCTW